MWTKAMPVSGGMASSSRWTASNPPAEAPIPTTIGGPFFTPSPLPAAGFSSGGVTGVVFFLVGVFMEAGSVGGPTGEGAAEDTPFAAG